MLTVLKKLGRSEKDYRFSNQEDRFSVPLHAKCFTNMSYNKKKNIQIQDSFQRSHILFLDQQHDSKIEINIGI